MIQGRSSRQASLSFFIATFRSTLNVKSQGLFAEIDFGETITDRGIDFYLQRQPGPVLHTRLKIRQEARIRFCTI